MSELQTTASQMRSCVDRLRALLRNTPSEPGQADHEAVIRSIREAIAALAALRAKDLDEVVHKAGALGDLSELIMQADVETLYWASRLAGSLTEDMKALRE
jgi:uncharacterized protein YcaQ